MSQPIPIVAGDEIPSPCNDICRIDPKTGGCEGCLRTLEEIAEWRFASATEKRAILDRIAARGKTSPSVPRS